MWSVVVEPTPVLNTPFFSLVFGGKTGAEIVKNERGFPFSFEWVAIPGTPLWIEQSETENVVRVSTPWYPEKPLFVDRRSLRLSPFPPPFPPSLPDRETILKRMIASLGSPYVWGGNWSSGIPHWLEYYPPRYPLDKETKTLWTFSGVDCSGLLYEATKGATPRNTSQLKQFGKLLFSSANSKEEILSGLQPLDMILCPGHVIFVENLTHTIESKFPFGVIRRELKKRLEEISPLNFSMRRFL